MNLCNLWMNTLVSVEAFCYIEPNEKVSSLNEIATSVSRHHGADYWLVVLLSG
jgi:hypothetical protein